MKQMKTCVALLLGASLAAGAGSVLASPQSRRASGGFSTAVQRVPVIVNGVTLGEDALMLKAVARTVLPMRALFTSLGAQVVWNAKERAVYAWRTDGTGVRFGVGDLEAQSLEMPAPGERAKVTEKRKLDAPPVQMGGLVYIPIRAAGEMLGTPVRWDEATASVLIGDQDAVAVRVDPEGDAKPEKR